MTDTGPLAVEYRHVPRLPAGSAESVAHLEEHGYVVVAEVLSTEQTEHALDLLWHYLEELGTGISRNDPDSWGDDRWPTTVHGGILPGHGIGQCAAQWYIRGAPALKDAFAAVWNDDDLLVSFDGVSIWRPWTRDEHWRTNRASSWFHIDQHPIGRPGFQCVQGLVNLLPTSPETGGNVVIPGSHLDFAELPTRYEGRIARLPSSVDHFRFPADDPLLSGRQPIMCHLEPGDLMLWDSRTIHCSQPSLERPAVDDQLLRAVSLVCMMPRARSTSEVIERRRRAVGDRTSTTNWSDVWVNADRFPEILAADSSRFTLPPVPELTEAQQALVG